MANTKIRIKAGDIEVDYEGDSSYLKSELPALIRELQKTAGDSAPGAAGVVKKPAKNSAPADQLTTKSIASKLNVKSASDLAKAALAHLVIMKGKDSVTRNEMLTEMKTATGYYKDSMSSNHTKTIKILLNDNTVVENSKDVFSLKPAAEEQLRSALAGG